MKFLFTVLFILLLSTPLLAAEDTEAVFNSIGELLEVVDSSFDPTRSGINSNCRNLINDSSSQGLFEIGPWGQELIKAIHRVGADCFYNKADFSLICPQYKAWLPGRKKAFLVFLWAGIIQTESSCNLTAQNSAGTNDIADGLTQLEFSSSQREGAGRDPTFCPHDGVNSQNLKFQMECSASIFKAGYCSSRKRVVGRDFWYWHELNKPEREATQLGKKFPGCF